MAAGGMAASTRRSYVRAFNVFHRFLTARRLVCPVDELNASRHVGDDFPAEPRHAHAVTYAASGRAARRSAAARHCQGLVKQFQLRPDAAVIEDGII